MVVAWVAVDVTVGGNVLASGVRAQGVRAYARDGAVNVNVAGEVSAYAGNGTAYGVKVMGTGNVSVGGVSAIAHGNTAYGVDLVGVGSGDWTLTAAKTVYARAYDGRAYGVLASGSASFTGNIGGDLVAFGWVRVTTWLAEETLVRTMSLVFRS